jgi:hypothetical protein
MAAGVWSLCGAFLAEEGVIGIQFDVRPAMAVPLIMTSKCHT